MKIKCIRNTITRGEEYPLSYTTSSDMVQYGALEIGEEYVVMGMILTQGSIFYLINGGRVISACPKILFQITDYNIPNSWYFNSFSPDYYNFVNMEAVWGYFELCFVDTHYEELIDMNENAHKIYFARKSSQLLEIKG